MTSYYTIACFLLDAALFSANSEADTTAGLNYMDSVINSIIHCDRILDETFVCCSDDRTGFVGEVADPGLWCGRVGSAGIAVQEERKQSREKSPRLLLPQVLSTQGLPPKRRCSTAVQRKLEAEGTFRMFLSYLKFYNFSPEPQLTASLSEVGYLSQEARRAIAAVNTRFARLGVAIGDAQRCARRSAVRAGFRAVDSNKASRNRPGDRMVGLLETRDENVLLLLRVRRSYSCLRVGRHFLLSGAFFSVELCTHEGMF